MRSTLQHAPQSSGSHGPTETTSAGSAAWSGVITAGALLVLAMVLPVGSVADSLAGDGVSAEALRGGMIAFKVMLAVHAAMILGLRWLPGGSRVVATGPSSSNGASVDAAPSDGRWLAILAVILVVAGVLRGIGLDSGLWHDEITTLVKYVRRPVAEIVSIYSSQNQHPLYSLLAHGSLVVFGESAWALRLPAMLFGVASLAATYWFAKQLVRPLEALLTTGFLAVSYHHVWFSQNARGYTILLLMTVVGTGLFMKMLREPARGWRLPVAYGTVMAAAIYAHLSAAFVVVAHGAVVAIVAARSWRERAGLDEQGGIGVRGAARWLPVFAAVILAITLSLQLYAIVLPQLLETLFGAENPMPATEWRSPLWMAAETMRGLGRGVPGGWLVLAAGAFVAAAGSLSFARRSPLPFALMVLPPVLVGVVMTALQHNLWPRLFFFAAAFAVMIVVRGVHAIGEWVVPRHGRALAGTALVLAMIASAWTVPRAWGPKQDFGGALAYVERERSAADAVVALGLSDFALLEYLRADWLAPRTGEELRHIEETHPRTWAVYTFPTHLTALYPDIGERISGYRVSAEFPGTVGGGTVYVMVNR